MRKHLGIFSAAIILVGLSEVLSIAQIPKESQDNQRIENGFYLIRGQGLRISDFEQRTDEDRVVPALRVKDTPVNSQKVMYLLRSTPDIPLDLLADPKVLGKSPSDRRLDVQLVDKLKVAFYRFTKNHLDDQIAIVVSNRVVMHAKIRSPIADGRFEISTCDGDLAWLQNALKRKPATR